MNASLESAYKGKPDVVTMRDRTYFFNEGDGAATIDVMRLGDCSGAVQVGYSAVGKGGSDYKAVSGTLTFEPGDGIETFKVQISNDATWETMEHFEVQLTAVETGNAVLGSVVQSVVYIVDDDVYPQNFACLEHDPPTEPKPWELMWGFVRERWATRHPKPIKSLCCRCYDSIHEVIATYVPVLIVDTYIKNKDLDWMMLGILAAVYLVSNLIKWYSEIKFMDWRGNSGTRKDLRNWLVTKFVYFSEAIHLEIENTHYFDCIINMVEEAVVNGWFQHFELSAALFDLALQLTLAIFLDWHAIIPVGLLIPVIIITIRMKQSRFEELLKIRMQAEDAWLHLVSDILTNWMLINSYNERDDRAGRFKKVYTDFYNKHRASRFFQLSYTWITKFANEVCLAIVFVFGAQQAINGNITVGKYMALIKIFQRIGGRLVKIAGVLIKFQRGIEGLRRVSEMLNFPVGVNEEIEMQKAQALEAQAAFDIAMATNKAATKFLSCLKKKGRVLTRGAVVETFEEIKDAQREIAGGMMQKYLVASACRPGLSELQQFAGGWTEHMVKAMLSVSLDNVQFKYSSNKGDSTLDGAVPVCNGLCGTLPLGHFIAIMTERSTAIGPLGGGGITTVMKLITSQLYPNKGQIRCPPHLHSLLVHNEPLILAEPLMKNLTFGNGKCEEEFAWKVAEALGLSPALLYKPGLHVGTGGFSLRLVDRQIVCIARALIADPHLLCIIKPAAIFGKEHSATVHQVLKDWQSRKGLWADGNRDSDPAAPDQGPILNTRTVIFQVQPEQDIPAPADIVATICVEEKGSVIKLVDHVKDPSIADL